MDVVFLIARILFAFLFLGSAMAHLTQTDAMTAYADSRGVPMARISVVVTGVLIAVGAVLVLIGLWGDLGALLLVVFLVPTAVLMHGFWSETDPAAKQQEMVQFNKDMALAGAALAFFVVFSLDEVGLTATDSLFGLG